MNTIARMLSVSLLVAGLAWVVRPAPAEAAVPQILDPRYFAGVNLTWYNWGCDFGCGDRNAQSAIPCQWGCRDGQGVSAPDVTAVLSGRFKELQAANVHTVRWWLFEGMPWQITHDATGPLRLNDAIYTDIDAALALADRYDLAYNFVLFEGPRTLPQAWMTDPAQRQRLADALAPLFDRYRDNPHILAWEIFNEPDVDVWTGNTPLDAVQQTISVLANTIHAHTSNLVTVGTAHADWVWPWVGLGLDFYQAHWYPWLDSGPPCVPCSDAASIGVLNHTDGKPIVVGEFYAPDQLQRLNDFRNKGFAGAWAWSLFPDRTRGTMSADLAALSSFTHQAATAPAAAAASVVPAPGGLAGAGADSP